MGLSFPRSRTLNACHILQPTSNPEEPAEMARWAGGVHAFVLPFRGT